MKLMILLVLCTFIASCNKIRYWLIVDNRSEKDISKVVVWYGTKVLSVGPVSVSAHSRSTNAGTKPKLLDEMKITWLDAEKKAHEQKFKTFDFIPEEYNGGNVIFVYQGNDKFILEFYMPKNNFPKLIE